MSVIKTNKSNNSRKHRSSYLAFDPETKIKEVITHGSSLGKVIDIARKKGIDNPIIICVPC